MDWKARGVQPVEICSFEAHRSLLPLDGSRFFLHLGLFFQNGFRVFFGWTQTQLWFIQQVYDLYLLTRLLIIEIRQIVRLFDLEFFHEVCVEFAFSFFLSLSLSCIYLLSISSSKWSLVYWFAFLEDSTCCLVLVAKFMKPYAARTIKNQCFCMFNRLF